MFLEHFPEEGRPHGWIEVICGSMFSGKTEELIRRLRRAEFANQKLLLVKPAEPFGQVTLTTPTLENLIDSPATSCLVVVATEPINEESAPALLPIVYQAIPPIIATIAITITASIAVKPLLDPNIFPPYLFIRNILRN